MALVDPPSSSSRAAIRGLTQSLARSLRTYEIRVNAVNPGVTETPMIETYDNAVRNSAVSRVPLDRIVLSKDVSDITRFLISGEARFITGQNISVNGKSVFG